MNAVEKLCAVVQASEDCMLLLNEGLAVPREFAGQGWCVQSFVTGETVPVAEAENICVWDVGMGFDFLVGTVAYSVQAVKLLDVRELI